ncbi:DsbA family protein [Natronorarus salvus]|uniref:DsbA family protein n=1 Tax=Natronorarus salvus TaxID=3117733 RepID=UPI002F264C8B
MTRTTAGRSRRDVLTAVGVTLGTVTTGCLGDGNDEDEDTESPITRSDHPATEDIEGPRLGPAVGDADATIVAFEDPSCPVCAGFAQGTLPTLREEAIDPGTVTYLYRATPGTEPWSYPATRALFSVHRRNSGGFWTLKDRYYEEIDGLDENSIYNRTLAILEADVADTDPDAVLEAMDGNDDAIEERMERDEAAATASDLTQTPSFVLFRDGNYRTTVAGNQPYDVFEGALEL